MTTLKTFKAIINGNLFTVDQLKWADGKQSMHYHINGLPCSMTADRFWNYNPIILPNNATTNETQYNHIATYTSGRYPE
jgi:hypothetical protein